MGGNSDLERRIMRLEQALPGVRQRIIKLGQLNGANFQAIRMVRESVGDGAPTTTTHTTTFCSSLALPDTVSGTDSVYGSLTLSWDGTLTFPTYSGGSISGNYTSSTGGWSVCKTVSYAGYYGYPAATIAITYKLTTTGFVCLYWKTVNPWTQASKPVANTCGDDNVSDEPTSRTITCPSLGTPGSIVFSVPGSNDAIYPSTGATITIDLPAL